MYYYIEVDNPPLTPIETPIVSTVKLARGKFEFVDIGFPDWNSRLTKCKLFYNTIQLIPFNRDRWLTGDNITLRVPVNLFLNDEPYEIQIWTYNPDDTFSHQLSFGLSLDAGDIQGIQGLQSILSPIIVQQGG